MYARHYALELLRLNNSKIKAMSLAQDGLRWSRNYNEECYWNRVIRELNLYEDYNYNFKWIDLNNVNTKDSRDKYQS